MTNFTTDIKKTPKKFASVMWRLDRCSWQTGWNVSEWTALGDGPRWRRGRLCEPPSAPSAVSGVIKFDCGPDYHAWWGGVTPALQHRGFTLIFPLLEVKEAMSDMCVNKHTGVGPYHSERGGLYFTAEVHESTSVGDYWYCCFSTWGNNEFAATFYLYFITGDLREFSSLLLYRLR